MLTPIPDLITIDYTVWPTAQDVVRQLIGGRYWPADADEREGNFISATAGIDSAISEFERRTGWYPFLADLTAPALSEPRTFDAADPQGWLDLESGLLDLQGVSIRGNAMVLNTNVFLRPSNSVSRSMPYTQLQFPYGGAFAGSVYAMPNTITVTGRWGRVRALPADVWFAVMRYAVYLTLTSGNQDQDIASWSEDGFSESLDVVGPLDAKTIAPLLRKEFDVAINLWRRVVTG